MRQCSPPPKPKRQTKKYLNEAYEYAKNQAKWKQHKITVLIECGNSRVMTEKIRYQVMATRPTDTDSNVNRVRGIADDIIGIKDPDDIMIALLEVLTEQPKTSVQPGRITITLFNADTHN